MSENETKRCPQYRRHTLIHEYDTRRQPCNDAYDAICGWVRRALLRAGSGTMIKDFNTVSDLHALIARARHDLQEPVEWRLSREVFDSVFESTETRWATSLFGLPIDVIPNNSRSFLLCEGGFKYILVKHIDMRR